MNEQNTKAQEAYKTMLEAHDVEVRQAAIAEVRDRLVGFVARLKEAAKLQLEAAEGMETLLMDKPATTRTRRKRAKTVATDKQVGWVKEVIQGAESYTNRGLPVGTIAEMANLEPGIAANACKQLEAQGWIKPVTDGYRWIPEEGLKEADFENGPVMIDDIKEQDIEE